MGIAAVAEMRAIWSDRKRGFPGQDAVPQDRASWGSSQSAEGGRNTEPLSSFTNRTDTLLLRLSVVVGREVFYAALWGSVLTSPSIRLPASLFVVNHISRDSPGKEQKYMLGTDYQLTVGALLPERHEYGFSVREKGQWRLSRTEWVG